MASADSVFAGAVPEMYTRYMGPMLFQPYADYLAGCIAGWAGSTILETACGTGIVTRALCRSSSRTVAITATDLNQPMLDHARTLPGGERVRWQQADAQALPFPDASFDVVVSAFGVMFFPDKVGAYREALRMLRPGGRFIFTVWDGIETIELQNIAHTAVAALYPRDPPSFLSRIPCGYHDVTMIRADLLQAGVHDASIETLERPSRSASARDAAIGFVRGTPLSAEISIRDPAGLDRAVEAVTEAIAARFGDASIEARMQAHVVTVQRKLAAVGG
ncbi:MAG TPA: class I SAM-dependent methyltransferase [Rhodopila sp.]